MKKKVIGVLGGMGPESTAIFYHELIIQCQKQYGAQYDEDYPEIFIYNLPIPNVVEGLKNPKKTLPVLVKGAKKMESIGVDFLVMPCNTAHYFFNWIKKDVSIPFLSIIEETAKKVKSKKYKKVGLLATETTIKYKIYEKVFDEYGIEIVVPKEQDKVTKIILNILAGRKLDKDKNELKKIIEKLKNNGAEAIILGCTDLPILLKPEEIDLETFDTVEVLAESTIKYAVKK
jgi:aspartate racemase